LINYLTDQVSFDWNLKDIIRPVMALQEIYDLSHRFHTAVQEKDDLNKDKEHLGIMVGSQETRVRKYNCIYEFISYLPKFQQELDQSSSFQDHMGETERKIEFQRLELQLLEGKVYHLVEECKWSLESPFSNVEALTKLEEFLSRTLSSLRTAPIQIDLPGFESTKEKYKSLQSLFQAAQAGNTELRESTLADDHINNDKSAQLQSLAVLKSKNLLNQEEIDRKVNFYDEIIKNCNQKIHSARNVRASFAKDLTEAENSLIQSSEVTINWTGCLISSRAECRSLLQEWTECKLIVEKLNALKGSIQLVDIPAWKNSLNRLTIATEGIMPNVKKLSELENIQFISSFRDKSEQLRHEAEQIGIVINELTENLEKCREKVIIFSI
jgi:hypothetical protein